MGDKLSSHYEMGEWKELPLWKCKHCDFNTLNGEEVMSEHLRADHFPPSVMPAPKPRIVEYSRFGKEMVVQEGDEDEVIETEAELAEDGLDVSALKVEDVLGLIESGELKKEDVIEAEREGKRRKSLLEALGEEA
jgi:hypothetical protein